MNETCIFNEINMENTCWTCLKTDQNLDTMSCDEVLWHQKHTSWSTNVLEYPEMRTRRICVICRQLLKKCVNFTRQCQKALEIITAMEGLGNDKISWSRPFQSVHNFSIKTFSTGLCYNHNECGLNLKIEQENCNYIEFNGNNGLQNNEFENSNTNNGSTNNCANNDNELFIKYDLEDNYVAVDDNYDLSDEDLPLKKLRNKEIKTCVKKRKNSHNKRSMKSARNKMKKDSDQSYKIKTRNENSDNDKVKNNTNNGFSTRMVKETEEYTVIKLTKEQVVSEMVVKSGSDQYTRSLYKCHKCVKGFNFEEVLISHQRKHCPENGDFKCDICEQYCPSAVSLRGHMKSHTTRYECKICGTVKLSRQHLLEHFGISHTDAASKYTCEHCTFVTEKRTVIQRHVRIHRTSANHSCELCGRLFTNMASLRVHTTRHDKSKSLQCERCSRKFIYPSLLQKHILAVHERSDYYCVECDVRFKSPDNLRLHFKKAKRHRDPSSYTHECPECSVKFISAASLAVHLTTTHGQPKTHACHLCPRLYSNRESLQGHIRRRHSNTTV